MELVGEKEGSEARVAQHMLKVGGRAADTISVFSSVERSLL
jgi:hypothetical protein